MASNVVIVVPCLGLANVQGEECGEKLDIRVFRLTHSHSAGIALEGLWGLLVQGFVGI